MRSNDVDGARAHFQRALTLAEKLRLADPENLNAQVRSATCYGLLGAVECRALNLEAAADLFERGAGILQVQEDKGKLKGRREAEEWLKYQQESVAICKAAPRAIADLGFALKQPAAEVVPLLLIRATALAKRGEHVAAADTAVRLRELAPDEAINLSKVARCYALCLAGVAAGKTIDQLTDDERAFRERYKHEALEALTRAVDRGLDYSILVDEEAEADLAALRGEPAYRALLERVNKTK